jgi:hypothetical protein
MYRFTPEGLRFARANAAAISAGSLPQTALGWLQRAWVRS